VSNPGPIVNNVNNNTNIQHSIVLQFFGTTASTLTPESVAEKVRQVLTLGAIEEGVAKMTEEVAPTVFTNEKKNWTLRVADASRKRLVVRMDEGDVPDIEGHNTTRLLRAPFMDATLDAIDQSDRPAEVKRTFEEIKDTDRFDRQVTGSLLRVAPTSFDHINPLIFTEAHRLEEERVFARVEAFERRERRKEQKQLDKRRKAALDDFLDKCIILSAGEYRHRDYGYVVEQTEGNQAFVILGKRDKPTDKTIRLTKVDLDVIKKLGLEANLAAEYRVKGDA
jgi:hypothetical protein